jgi:hypothetical protein
MQHFISKPISSLSYIYIDAVFYVCWLSSSPAPLNVILLYEMRSCYKLYIPYILWAKHLTAAL